MKEKFKISLVGNPNCGKTTLFNELTGAKHTVGNWPGVTVEQKSGYMKYQGRDSEFVEVVDLPGTYSLNAYSLEETITRNYILDKKSDLIINILDVSNLERNLYLTLQLQELKTPMIIVLNMMDIAERKGFKIDVDKLSEVLGVPVFTVSASKGNGINELKKAIVDSFESEDSFRYPDILYSTKIEEYIQSLSSKRFNHDVFSDRYLSIKMLEQDYDTLNYLGVYTEDKIDDLHIKDSRYEVIKRIVSDIVLEQGRIKEKISNKIDTILMHPVLGILIFGLLMYFVFTMTFSIGDIVKEPLILFVESFGEFVRDLVLRSNMPIWFSSLLVDGIINGVGGVLTFLPNIAILFLALSILEESGYMTRAAFLMDRYMQKIGLSGKAFIPLIMGFGCSVPAIMGTRIMEDEKDKLTAMLIIPFMSCGAKMPIYVLFSSLFFKGHEALVMFSMYALGIFVAVLMGIVARTTVLKGDDMPYIMELPTYRLPSLKGSGISVWQRIRDYITKAGTLIFAASVVVWVFLNFNLSGASELTDSLGYHFGRILAPIFTPLGFGNWQATLSLITGLVAKEVVVSNMNIFYGTGGSIVEAGRAIGNAFSLNSAYSFMVFSLLYTPCIATLGIIKKESNSWKFTGLVLVYQILVAWIFSFIIYTLSNLFGIGKAYMIILFIIAFAVILMIKYREKMMAKRSL